MPRPRWMIGWSSSGMKLLLDQGLPRTSAARLRSLRIDAVHTGEIGLATAEDAEILEKARREKRVVVTLDADFHALLALTSATEPSVIRIRIEGLRAQPVTRLLQKILIEWEDELNSGVMLSVQPGQIRIRHLPIVPV